MKHSLLVSVEAAVEAMRIGADDFVNELICF
jgi:hypothetical protein